MNWMVWLSALFMEFVEGKKALTLHYLLTKSVEDERTKRRQPITLGVRCLRISGSRQSR